MKNKAIFAALAATSLVGLVACGKGDQGGTDDFEVNSVPAESIAASESIVAAPSAAKPAPVSLSIPGMAQSYREYTEQQAVERRGDQQQYLDTNTVLVSDGEKVIKQATALNEEFGFTPRYALEILVLPGDELNPSATRVRYCKLGSGPDAFGKAIDQLEAIEESADCASASAQEAKPQFDKALSQNFRDALGHIHSCLGDLEALRRQGAQGQVDARCQSLATLRF